MVQSKPKARILISRNSRPKEVTPQKPVHLAEVLDLAAAALKLPGLSGLPAPPPCSIAELLGAALRLR